MHSPMEQFEIKRLLDFRIGSLDASYTNSALWMTIAVILAFLLFVVGSRRNLQIDRGAETMVQLPVDFAGNGGWEVTAPVSSFGDYNHRETRIRERRVRGKQSDPTVITDAGSCLAGDGLRRIVSTTARAVVN